MRVRVYLVRSFQSRGRGKSIKNMALPGGEGSKIKIFLRIYFLPFKMLCMVVSSSKIIIIDSRCGISLRLLRKFQNNRFSGAANGHQNWNIMIFLQKKYAFKMNVFKLYAILIYLIVESDRSYSGRVCNLYNRQCQTGDP